MHKARAVLLGLIVLVAGTTAANALVATLAASKDNSIFQEFPTRSDGAGPEFYAGNTAVGNQRRALIAFNTASIPPGSMILSVDLALTVTGIPRSPAPASEVVELHRLLADWGEAGSSGDGQGDAAQTGDATWNDRFFMTDTWATAGGDFSPTASGQQTIGGTGVYHWISTPGMRSDVQGWVNNPSSNFGWLLLGDESINKTARAFASRTPDEAGDEPVLTITFVPPPGAPTLSTGGIIGLAIALAFVGTNRLRHRAATV